MHTTVARPYALRLVALGLVVGFVAALGVLLVPSASAQDQSEEGPPPALLLILDSSGSMNADDGSGQPKIAAAKNALNGMVDSIPEEALVGLRVYGHRIPNTDKQRGCQDTELIAPVGPLRRADMKSRIRSFDAKGFTPIGLSLKKAAGDLRGQQGDKTIVLVSDGIDTCAPPPPCEVARNIVRKGIDLRIDTVGFQVDPKARAQLECIARVGKGTYVDAGSAEELAKSLEQASIRALRLYEAVGIPVNGAPASDGAPEIAAGQYVDSIRSLEEKWYAVELAPGESLQVSATLASLRNSPDPADSFLVSEIVGPQLERLDREFAMGVGRDTGTVVTSASAVPEGGTHYVQVVLDDKGVLSGLEFPLELVVQTSGATTPTPAESPTPEDTTTQDEEPAGSAADGAGEANPDSASGATLYGGVVLFGLLGAALGAITVKRMMGI